MPLVCLSSNRFYKVRFYVISNLSLKMVVRQSWLGEEHIALFSGVCLYTYIYIHILWIWVDGKICVYRIYSLLFSIWLMQFEWLSACKMECNECSEVKLMQNFNWNVKYKTPPHPPSKKKKEKKWCLYSVAKVFESKWCFKSVAGLWISSGLFCYIEVHHYMCLQNLHVRV